MQVDFYQLSRDPVEKLLPSIAQRILGGGGRLLIVASDGMQIDRVSAGLWQGSPESFLAHGRAGEENADLQPILLSHGTEAANGAQNIALVDGVWRDEALGYERAFYFFDAHTVEGARQSWRVLSKTEGVEPRFWRQEGRKWVQGP